MNLFFLFLKSFIAGIIIFAPLGPATAISVRRALNRGFWAGFVSGMGAVTADMICATIAGFGVLSVIGIINNNRAALAGVSALFLFVIGTRILLSPSVPKAVETADIEIKKFKWHSDYFSIFFLTITNPTTLLQFFFVFPWLGLNIGNIYLNLFVAALSLLVSGLFWWTIVCSVANYGRTKLSQKAMEILDRSLGFIVLTIATILLLSTQLNQSVFDWLYHFIT